jgi:hypothetical protein
MKAGRNTIEKPVEIGAITQVRRVQIGRNAFRIFLSDNVTPKQREEYYCTIYSYFIQNTLRGNPRNNRKRLPDTTTSIIQLLKFVTQIFFSYFRRIF